MGCLLPSQGVAADLVFTGNLRFATKTFIHVRLADGRVIDAGLPKTGPLAAEAILGQYKIADQVQITCKTVSADLDPTVDYRHSLELKQIRFLRAPTPDEVAGVHASLSWTPGENLLKPGSVAPAPKRPAPAVPKEFEQIRPVNLEYLSNLPNFIADEVAVRTHKPKGSDKFKEKDTEVAFTGRFTTREHIRFNGKPYNKPTHWLPGGPTWAVGFGELYDLCSTRTARTRSRSRAARMLEACSFVPSHSAHPWTDALAPGLRTTSCSMRERPAASWWTMQATSSKWNTIKSACPPIWERAALMFSSGAM